MSFDEIEMVCGAQKERVFPHSNAPKADREKSWGNLFIPNDKLKPRGVSANVELVLKNDDDIYGKIRYDTFSHKIIVMGPMPYEDHRKPKYVRPVKDSDYTNIRNWLQRRHELFVSKNDVVDAVRAVADEINFHQVQEYLRKLRWDGERRIDSFLVDYFGCDDNEYVRAVSGKFLISAVARVLEPGCKVDTMLIIEGKQGIGKSRGIRELMPRYEWFSSMSIDPDSKDTIEMMLGKWLIEYAELAGMSKRESNSMKKFLTTEADDIRRAYDKESSLLPRQGIFVGTTNDNQYLVDETGDRRYWPVHATKIDVDGISAIRDQLWAEARDMWLCGAEWHLTPEEEHAADEVRGVRRVVDIWEEVVLEYIDRVGSASRQEIMEKALFLPVKDQHAGNAKRVKIILETNGYKQFVTTRNRRSVRVYASSGQ